MSNLIPLFFVFALVVWTWAATRLQRAAQPLRIELAEKGERLLGDKDLPEPLRDFVRFLLDTAFSNLAALVFGVFYVPYLAVSIAISPERVTNDLRRFQIPNPETRAAFNDVMRLHDRVTLANHPILLLVVEIEILFFVGIAILFAAIFREAVSPEMGRDAAMDLVDETGILVRKHLSRRRLAYAQ